VQELLMAKWGRLYDLSFVKRSLPGVDFVSLNVLWLYRGQRSFKLTREQYDEKVDAVAALVNALGQTDKARRGGGAGRGRVGDRPAARRLRTGRALLMRWRQWVGWSCAAKLAGRPDTGG
jgi:hypothetical protein